ncbi:MAG: iron-containing alcohol dehydrogenase, partial [Methylococcales bacterium]|nr:iron-containing alcohol dehydrogenase [Methylococcales bacterium]
MNYSANWNYPTNMKVGAGRVDELPALCQSLGMSSPLLITDPGLAELPMLSAVVEQVNNAGLRCGLFSGIKANPTGENVDSG